MILPPDGPGPGPVSPLAIAFGDDRLRASGSMRVLSIDENRVTGLQLHGSRG